MRFRERKKKKGKTWRFQPGHPSDGSTGATLGPGTPVPAGGEEGGLRPSTARRGTLGGAGGLSGR